MKNKTIVGSGKIPDPLEYVNIGLGANRKQVPRKYVIEMLKNNPKLFSNRVYTFDDPIKFQSELDSEFRSEGSGLGALQYLPTEASAERIATTPSRMSTLEGVSKILPLLTRSGKK